MFSLNRHTIGARLATGFALMLVLLLLTAAVGLMQGRLLVQNTDDYHDHVVPALDAVHDAGEAMHDMRRFETQHVATSDQHARLDADIAKSRKAFDEALVRYQALLASTTGQNLLAAHAKGEHVAKVRAAATAYFQVQDEVLKQSRAGSGDTARTLVFGDSAQRFATLAEAQDAWWDDTSRTADELAKDANEDYRVAVIGSAVSTALALVVGIVAAVVLQRSVTRPLKEAVAVAKAVADGDLTTRITVSGRDETAELLDALQHMNARLHELVSAVRESSDSIATGAQQISAGNSDLARRTEEQAASLEQTSASMDEMDSSLKASAETAREAARLAGAASGVATQGGTAVDRVVATMDDISASSRKIADIISVIDGIAFQTNILALNAAVEAARAGEQGRGFAVVAGEVRTLAQRSAEAAREIRSLITGSLERVDAGSVLVTDAGATITRAVAEVHKVAELINGISTATNDQTNSIGEVHEAVLQLDQMTQQNATLVEESANAAGSLAQQAQRLVAAVGAFRLQA